VEVTDQLQEEYQLSSILGKEAGGGGLEPICTL